MNMTPRQAWLMSLSGLTFNTIGAVLLLFFPPSTVILPGLSPVSTWEHNFGFNFGVSWFVLGFMVQFVAQLSQRPE